MTGPLGLPLLTRSRPDHITTVLEDFGKSKEIEHKENKGARLERLVGIGLLAGLVVFFTLVVLPEHAEPNKQIVGAIGIFLAGGFGGYGMGVRRGRNT